MQSSPQELPALHSAGPSRHGVTISYRGSAAAQPQVRLNAAPGGGTEVWLHVDSPVTDLYLTVPLAGSRASETVWNPGLSGRFLTLAVEAGADSMQLGLAGLVARPIAQDPGSGLEARLAGRGALQGEVLLCTIRPAGKPRPSADRSASTVHPAPAMTFTSAAGQPSLAWIPQLMADGDQNGEVNIQDITPLAVCFGTRRDPQFGWLLDVQRRCDGDGNGEINAADLTAIGRNFGQRLAGFRLERSLGTAAGPGEWAGLDTISELGQLDRSGGPVTALGSDRRQTIPADAQPGWPYHRVTQIVRGADGAELPQEPGEWAAAPDLVAPDWPAGSQLSPAPELSDRHFVFAQDATDDRGGAVEYVFELAVQPAAGEYVVTLAIDGDMHPDGTVASPFLLTYLLPSSPDPVNVTLEPQADYWVRIVALDTAGNRRAGDWLLFQPQQMGGPQIVRPRFDNDSDWEAWVNRQGDLRVTPPRLIYFGADLEQPQLFTLTLPASQFLPEDFDTQDPTAEELLAAGAEAHPYNGVELTVPAAVSPGERLYMWLIAQNSRDEAAKTRSELEFSGHWLRPFVNGNSFHAYADCWQLPQGKQLHMVSFMQRPGMPEFSRHALFDIDGANYREVHAPDYTPFQGSGENVMLRPALTEQTILVGQPAEARALPAKLHWFDLNSGTFDTVEFPLSAFWGNGLEYQGVAAWNAENAQTALGAVKRLRENAAGEQVIQVWEARRSGSHSLRAELPCPGMNPVLVDIEELHLLGGDWLFEYQFGPLLSLQGRVTRFRMQKEDGAWFDFSSQDLPADIAGRFDKIEVADWQIRDPESFICVVGRNDGDLRAWVHLYKGDARNGFASFTRVWGAGAGGVIDPRYPQYNYRFNATYLVGKGMNYHASKYFMPQSGQLMLVHEDAGGTHHLWVGQDGRIRAVFPEFSTGMIRQTRPGFENASLQHAIGWVRLSADGEWMAPVKPAGQFHPSVTYGMIEKINP